MRALGRFIARMVITAIVGTGFVVASPADQAAAAAGRADTVTLSAPSETVDANDPTTTFTVTPSIDVASPYYLTVYDDTGRKVRDCRYGYPCSNADGYSFSIDRAIRNGDEFVDTPPAFAGGARATYRANVIW